MTHERSGEEPDLVVAPVLTRLVRIVDSILVVGVANAPLSHDRNRKCRLYAEAGAPCHWIVEISPHRVRVLWDRSGGDYRSERVVSEQESLELPEVGAVVPLTAFLPMP